MTQKQLNLGILLAFGMLVTLVACLRNTAHEGEGSASPAGAGNVTAATHLEAVTSPAVTPANLQLRVFTHACDARSVTQYFQVTNAGATSVKVSDITIKYWIDDTTGNRIVTHVNGGGCLEKPRGDGGALPGPEDPDCFKGIKSVTSTVTSVSPACGPDATHQANWEVALSNQDSSLLPPGDSWTHIQAHVDLQHDAFAPGTADWYSQCLTGRDFAFDTHFAVYLAGNLVTTSPGIPPSCVAPHGSQPVSSTHVPPGLETTFPLVGPLPPETPVTLAIGLPLVNEDNLRNVISQISDPTSPNYRQYLAPDQFAATYGPPQADYTSLQNFVTSNGLSVASTFTGRELLSVTGTAGAVESALFVTLNVYQRPDGTSFFAPANDPSLNTSLSNPVLHISGLDSLTVPTPSGGTSTVQCPTGSAGYFGPDFRKLYLGSCASSTSLFGLNQTVALFELDSYNPANVSTYESGAGLSPGTPGTPLNSPNFPANMAQVQVTGPGTVATGGFSPALFAPSTVPGQSEAELGMEMVLAMAPQANIIVYEQFIPGGLTSAFNPDAILGQLAEPVPSGLPGAGKPPQVIVNSWTWNGSTRDPNLPQLFEHFASQGQSFFQASGDVGSYGAITGSAGGGAGLPVPDPIIDTSLMTVVGGTAVAGFPPQEVTWNNPNERTAPACAPPVSSTTIQNGTCASVSGGGFCSGLAVPSYQRGIGASNPDIPATNTARMIPDVSMIADQLAVVTRATSNAPGCSQGTTASAALWGGFAAIANQSANGLGTVGFANPEIYFLASSASPPFNDIGAGSLASNNNYSGSGAYSARSGYDLATGWGSPSPTSCSLVTSLPTQSCMPGTSVSALLRGKNVTAYVPAGSWGEANVGLFAVPVETAPVNSPPMYPPLPPPVTISTPAPTGLSASNAVLNTCAGNSQTGEVVCVSNGTTVWTIDGTQALASQTASPLQDGADPNHVEVFSGGICSTCNVTIDPVHNLAYLSIATSADSPLTSPFPPSPTGAAFQILNLATNTFLPPIPTGQQATSEDISVDPLRQLILSPNEGQSESSLSDGGGPRPNGDYQLVNPTTNAVFDFVPASTNFEGEFDSAAEDCQTGIALATDEFTNSLFLVDLNQITFSGTIWTSGTGSTPGYQFVNFPEFNPFSEAGISGIAVVSDQHIGVVGGEFGGTTFIVIKLPSVAGGTPALQDYVLADIPNTPDGQPWSLGHDPHTLTAYKSPNNGAPYAIFENDPGTFGGSAGGRNFLAIIDLNALLVTRARSAPGSHVLATPLGPLDTCQGIDANTGVNPAGCIVRFIGSASGL